MIPVITWTFCLIYLEIGSLFPGNVPVGCSGCRPLSYFRIFYGSRSIVEYMPIVGEGHEATVPESCGCYRECSRSTKKESFGQASGWYCACHRSAAHLVWSYARAAGSPCSRCSLAARRRARRARSRRGAARQLDVFCRGPAQGPVTRLFLVTTIREGRRAA